MGVSKQSQFAILGMLSMGPMSGYDLRKAIENTISNFWYEGYGQIYPALKSLEQAGSVKVHVEVGENKPDRKVYQMTEQGLESLKGWLREDADEFNPTRNEMLLKLFFGGHVERSVNIRHVQRHREVMSAYFDALKETEARIPRGLPDTAYWMLTVEYGQHLCRGVLEWCDKALKQLDALDNSP